MSLRQKYLKILSEMTPAGAVGISLLLGSTAPVDANQHPAAMRLAPSDLASVSERLAAIRDAVSDVPRMIEPGDTEQQLAWGNWWRNGGWRRPGWRNGGWGNWRGPWRNGGWPNWWHNW
jgi:hypothetical protein